jgi:hypothetical protein
MPTPAEILDSLTRIANEASNLAIGWHAVLALSLVVLLVGWRPSQRAARVLVALPFVSVSALGFGFGNPFNGTVFATAAAALITVGFTSRSERVSRSTMPVFLTGLASVAFGWGYPHFLHGDWTAYLYAAPFGLVPCPTLAVACGLALLGNGLGSRAWTITLAALGLFYGVFGVFRLGVYLDMPLFLSSALLLYVGLTATRRAEGSYDHRGDKRDHVHGARTRRATLQS